MLSYHETEICEGIIQHLERRHHATRQDVREQDKTDPASPDARVEMTFRLNGQLYAIEHTGIEPFDGFMAHQNRSADLFRPLEEKVSAKLAPLFSTGVVIELHLPFDAFTSRKMPDVRSIHATLAAWVIETAPTLPPRKYADYRGTLLTAVPNGLPFTVSLVRFDPVGPIAGRFQLKHLTPSTETSRAARISRACDKKFPKLTRWKEAEGARTILVFEDNDVQLTNTPSVAEAFLPIARTRADAPDETYMVSTYTSPWYAWPLLVDGRSYFDLAAIHDPVHFEMEATGQLFPLVG